MPRTDFTLSHLQ